MTGINGNPDPFILDMPNLIDCGIMGHCHNRCEFCYQGGSNQPNMKLGDYQKIINQARSHVNQIALGGRGDPNKHENFKEIIEYTRVNRIIPNYTTSGKYLTEEEVEISKGCGAVAVSDYSEKFTFEALDMFMKAGIKTNIHFVLSSKSFDKAMRMLNGEDVWNGQVDLDRLNAVIFLKFKPQGNGKNLDWDITSEQAKRFYEAIHLGKTKFKVGMDSCMVNRVKRVCRLTPNEELSLDTCEGSRMSCYISSDMKLMPCSFGNHSECGVKIEGENSIENIWQNNKIFTDFRGVLKNNPASCPFEL